jgi:hypothetical protein
MAVAAGETNCRLPMRANGGDQGFVHSSGKNHESGVTGFGVGDAETRDELALLAHLSEGAGQLHAAAVDDCNLIPVGDEIGDRLAGRVENLFVLEGGTA